MGSEDLLKTEEKIWKRQGDVERRAVSVFKELKLVRSFISLQDNDQAQSH